MAMRLANIKVHGTSRGQPELQRPVAVAYTRLPGRSALRYLRALNPGPRWDSAEVEKESEDTFSSHLAAKQEKPGRVGLGTEA